MLQIFAFNELAIVVRHWFEVGPEDEEHGARVEVRRLKEHPHRGSESAPQILEVDEIVWRADLFESLNDEPGSWSRAHHHLEFDGIEPPGRDWDEGLTADPIGWTRRKLEDVAALTQLEDPDGEAEDVRRALPAIMAAVEAYQPTRCRSPEECRALTRDTREIVAMQARLYRDGDPRDPRT
jgi:hypothetical protein